MLWCLALNIADVAGGRAIRSLSIAAAGGGDDTGERSSNWIDSRIRAVAVKWMQINDHDDNNDAAAVGEWSGFSL